MAGIAVIRTGGKQYLVKEGSVLSIEKIQGAEEGTEVSFEVLLTDNGTESAIGTPTVSGAALSGTVTKTGRGKKKIVIKYKAKSRYFKKRGHRQPFLQVKIGKV